MRKNIIITCALTDAGQTVKKKPHVPVTPKEIANAAIDAVKAGAAIVYGPGLRWALMGPFLTLHLAGGELGMKHMPEHFGPSLNFHG